MYAGQIWDLIMGAAREGVSLTLTPAQALLVYDRWSQLVEDKNKAVRENWELVQKLMPRPEEPPCPPK